LPDIGIVDVISPQVSAKNFTGAHARKNGQFGDQPFSWAKNAETNLDFRAGP